MTNLEDFLDQQLDTGDVGSIDDVDRNEKSDKSDSKDGKKKDKSKKDSGGIFSRGSRKKKLQAWFKNN